MSYFKKILAIGNVQSGKTAFMIKTVKEKLNGDYDVAIILGGTNVPLLEQSHNRFIEALETEEKITLRDVTSKNWNIPGIGKKLVITSLKHQDYLRKMISWVKQNPNYKYLIVDDESDFGSINNFKTKESVIYSLIKELINITNYGSFYSVTATPYADILTRDSAGYTGIEHIPNSKGYTGLEQFFESNSYIPVEDPKKLRRRQDKKQLRPILASHIARIIILDRKHTQFLINTNLEKKFHDKFEHGMKKLCNMMMNKPVEFTEQVNETIKEEFNCNVIAEKEQVVKILQTLKRHTYLLNQHNKKFKKTGHVIIIGGQLISRGYTFEHLTTCLMLNEAKGAVSADALLQRARWFGYRKHLEYIKIFTSERIIKAYNEVKLLNDIIYSHDQVDEIKKIIKSTKFEVIKPTGKNV